jgi:hypothetical protein
MIWFHPLVQVCIRKNISPSQSSLGLGWGATAVGWVPYCTTRSVSGNIIAYVMARTSRILGG